MSNQQKMSRLVWNSRRQMQFLSSSRTPAYVPLPCSTSLPYNSSPYSMTIKAEAAHLGHSLFGRTISITYALSFKALVRLLTKPSLADLIQCRFCPRRLHRWHQLFCYHFRSTPLWSMYIQDADLLLRLAFNSSTCTISRINIT